MNNNFPRLANGYHVSCYEILCHLGTGGYGDLYVVKSERVEGEFAMKIEYFSSKNQGLITEIRFLSKLKSKSEFPTLIDDGVGTDFRFFVMELFGPSIFSMKRLFPNKHFDSYTVCVLAYHMLDCIQKLHSFGIVHRDIKPANFLIRPDRNHPLVLIDFGLSKYFFNFESNQHIYFDDESGFTGTCRYASVNAHKEYELSRRDDLFSWFYSIMEIARGSLPWPGSKDKQETQRMKSTMQIDALCDCLPQEFKKIYMNIRSLKFSQDPDYQYIKNLIHKAIAQIPQEEHILDWEKLSHEEIERVSFIPLNMGDHDFPEEASSIPTADGGCTSCYVI